MVYHEKYPENCLLEYTWIYYHRYIDEILIPVNSPEHLIGFESYLKSHHVNITFTITMKKATECPFWT